MNADLLFYMEVVYVTGSVFNILVSCAGKHEHLPYNKVEGDTFLVGILFIYLFVSSSIVLRVVQMEEAHIDHLA